MEQAGGIMVPNSGTILSRARHTDETANHFHKAMR
jgi:hypothetical protein